MQGDIQQANAKANKMESNLVQSKHELLKVQEMLEMAEKELEKKVRLCFYTLVYTDGQHQNLDADDRIVV